MNWQDKVVSMPRLKPSLFNPIARDRYNKQF